MMNPLRLSTVPFSSVPVPVLRSVVLATGVVGLLAISGPEANQTTGATPRADISADISTPSVPISEGLAGTLQLASPQQNPLQPSPMSIDDLRQTQLGETHLDQIHLDQTQPARTKVAMAEPSLAGASLSLKMPEPVAETAPADVPQAPPAENAPLAEQALPNEPAPVQIASVNPAEVDLSDIQPANPGKAVTSVEIMDECFVVEICVDRYLWALYERTRKEDTIKQVEWRNVTVERKIKVKGKTRIKMVTVSKAFTKLVDQDFTWKDPKAAERARMPMMDYVIGGMDRRFKLKLFHLLHAAEAAGLSPGITSAFRDDYRQSIASGLKAASNRSYHGGSLRGGYGHGVAADVVSVDGGTRNARWANSDKLWKWVDANGKQFGIARPYLGRDPPHVAPVDGQEYAKHSRGTKVAAADAKKADAKKADAKKTSIKLAGAKTKNVSLKQAQADVKNAKEVNAKADLKKGDLKKADLRKVDLKKANANQINAKKPNLVIMRDAARPAKRPKTATASKLKDG